MHKFIFIAAAMLALSACGDTKDGLLRSTKPVVNVSTPHESAAQCMRPHLASLDKVFAVTPIVDMTKKANYESGSGPFVTSAAGDMLMTAMTQALPFGKVVERISKGPLEWETTWALKKLLGDGKLHQVGDQQVSYRPVKAGSIMGSDFYITGSISQFNLNTDSVGGEFRIAGIGPRARAFEAVVGIDMRLVETQTSRVVSAVALNKIIIAEDMGFGVARFFGSTLVLVDAGRKRSEPTDVVLRAMMNEGFVRMMASMTGKGAECVEMLQHLEGVEDSAIKKIMNRKKEQPAEKPAEPEQKTEKKAQEYQPALYRPEDVSPDDGPLDDSLEDIRVATN